VKNVQPLFAELLPVSGFGLPALFGSDCAQQHQRCAQQLLLLLMLLMLLMLLLLKGPRMVDAPCLTSQAPPMSIRSF
jgi:hypothetical protein